jgi:acyl-[acyl-carrier-protein]-phospholipid O-acyltransferase/long-chain-fatty-acid--[acyl-carrier-protein] ligase
VRSKLFQRGYLALVVTQFFGAANDNILKGVLIFAVAAAGVWSGALGDGGQSYVAFCLSIPFILFSGYGGQIADRVSKQRMTVVIKIIEIGVALVALVGFWMGNVWVGLAAMVLLATQSAFFGPAKYGMIPELVNDRDLSRANGMINMFTNIAVIVGTVAAGPLYEAWAGGGSQTAVAERSAPMPWVPGVIMILIAALGLGAALFLPRLRAQAPGRPFDWNPMGTYFRATIEMARSPLLTVALAWSFFYLIGMMALLILPDYPSVLGISEARASILLGTLGVAIGIGSVIAGLVSGHHIEPRLIPIGAIGMTGMFLALGLAPPNFWIVAVLLLVAGIFAGCYIVPLQALLQFLSPDDERGRFLGTANAISFVCITAGSLIFLLARRVLQMDANRIFLVCAALAFVGTGVLNWAMRRLIADPALRRRSATEGPSGQS